MTVHLQEVVTFPVSNHEKTIIISYSCYKKPELAIPVTREAALTTVSPICRNVRDSPLKTLQILCLPQKPELMTRPVDKQEQYHRNTVNTSSE